MPIKTRTEFEDMVIQYNKLLNSINDCILEINRLTKARDNIENNLDCGISTADESIIKEADQIGTTIDSLIEKVGILDNKRATYLEPINNYRKLNDMA